MADKNRPDGDESSERVAGSDVEDPVTGDPQPDAAQQGPAEVQQEQPAPRPPQFGRRPLWQPVERPQPAAPEIVGFDTDNNLRTTVMAITQEDADKTPLEIWCYSSGGSFRSALGTLGAMWYLDRVGHWPSVSRMVSVSGGSMTNAAQAMMPNHAPHEIANGLYRNIVRVPRWAHRLFNGVAVLLIFVALVVLWLLIGLLDSVHFILGALLSLVILAVIVLALGFLVQRISGFVVRYRLRRAVGAPRSLRLRNLPVSNRTSVFSSADYRSGQPFYVVSGPDHQDPNSPLTRSVHDLALATNLTGLFDGDDTRLLDAVYASGALPGLMTMSAFTASRVAARAAGVGQHPPPLESGAYYSQGPDPSSDPNGVVTDFAFMDGGLNSTLGSRLDPALMGLTAEHGAMPLIDWEYPTSGANQPTNAIRRIVVDSGQYLRRDGAWRASLIPGISAAIGLYRGITIANLSLLSSDRQLADRPDVDIWFVPVTGGGRTFRLRFTQQAADLLNDPTSAQVVAGAAQAIQDLQTTVGSIWQPAPGATPAEAAQIAVINSFIKDVIKLKELADRVETIAGIDTHGLDAVKSGLASAYVEHRGIGVDRTAFDAFLGQLDTELQVGIHPMLARNAAQPVMVSHRGVGLNPMGGANKLADFERALLAGFRVLEVDAQRTKDHRLVAWHDDDQGFKIATTDSGDLPANTLFIDDLFTPLIEGQLATAAGDEPFAWNIEAKDAGSAEAVARLVVAAGRSDVLFSGGWKARSLRAFRNIAPYNPTATGLWEAILLFLGGSPRNPRVLQVPEKWYIPQWVINRLVKQAHARDIRVYWFDIEDEADLATIWPKGHTTGFMLDGDALLNWV